MSPPSKKPKAAATPLEDYQALNRELQGTSDRAAAIVAGSFLDNTLQQILVGHLVPDVKSDDKLFKGMGVLATFSSKIEMCYRLGLISAGERRTLHIIRDIRNEFAHVLNGVSFDKDPNRGRCLSIEVPLARITPTEIPLSQNGEPAPLPKIEKALSTDARGVFQQAVITLMHGLSARTATAQVDQRMSPAEFTAAHEPGEAMIARLKALLARTNELKRRLGEQRTRISKLKNDLGAAAADDFCAELDDVEMGSKKDMEKWELALRLNEYCVEQIRKAHEAIVRNQ